MKIARLLIGFCVGAMLTSCVSASRQAQDALRGQVALGKPIPESALLPIMARNHVPAVSIAVVRGGEIDWARDYGVREAGGSDRVDDKTLFQAASISKPVTAAAALRMVEAGELYLDEDVNKKLQTWKVPGNEFTARQPVTLRELLSHSAGLTVHGFPGYVEGAVLPTLLQILNGEKPANTEPIRVDIEPGTKFRYSGGGYVVAQQLMTDLAAKPFPELMRKLVLEPAGMSSSTFEQPLPENRQAEAAAGHRSDGRPVAGHWHVYPEMAAAGLWTTPTDLARFAIEIRRAYKGLSDRLLSQTMAQAMLTRRLGDYGLGFSVPSAGVFRFQHGGGNEGYRCFLVLSVESGDGVAVMTNADSGEVLFEAIIAAIGAAYGWSV
jgi:CubicO group peptidase (beta-lactamase class C family)